jgi:hypothetical protein
VSIRRQKLEILNLAEMVAQRPPPVPWVVEPIVARGALTLLAGVAGQGKSLVSMALAIAATRRGTTALAGMNVQPALVVIVDAENGRAEIHRRVHALGLDADAIDRLTIFEADGFDLAADLSEIDAVVAKDATFLILDSWRSLWRGDERDEAEVASVLDPLRNLVRRHDTGGLLIHHARRDGTGYRGSGAIAASVELAFLLDREPDDPDSGRRRLRCEKSRLAPEPSPRWLRLATEDELAAGCPLIREADSYSKPDRERAPREASVAAEISAVLAAQGPMRRSEIARKLDRPASDGTVRRAVERAVATGSIAALPDGRWTVASQVGNADDNVDDSLANLQAA